MRQTRAAWVSEAPGVSKGVGGAVAAAAYGDGGGGEVEAPERAERERLPFGHAVGHVSSATKLGRRRGVTWRARGCHRGARPRSKYLMVCAAKPPPPPPGEGNPRDGTAVQA